MILKHLLLASSFFAACFMHAANAQVPALYGSTSLLQWQQMSALGNTVALGSDRITAINAGNYSISSGVGTDLAAVTRAKVPIGNANLVVDVVAKVPKAAVVKAIGSFLLKAAAPISTIVGLVELGQELKFILGNDVLGQPQISKTTTVSEWYTTPYGGHYSSIAEVRANAATRPGERIVETLTNDYGETGFRVAGDGYMLTVWAWPRGGTVETLVPSTRQEFIDAVAAKSDWPTSSAIGKVFKSAIQSGEVAPVEPQTVTGPASTPGTTTSSTTSGSPAVAPTSGTSTSPGTSGSPAVDSITTTSTTTNNYKYDGNTITVTNTTVTNITNNTTGQQQTTKTDKAPELKNADLKPDKAATPDKVEDPATDTALGDVPKLYTPVYPRGIEGVWADQKAAMSGSSLARLVPSLMPNVGSGGQCPTMPINLNLSSWANFGTVDVAPPCFLWDFGKVVIIMSALLLARGLVFGG